ncbi:MAG: PLP-dependent aminotransferase family protein [Anaerolineae bacterium]|jgi:2-aminoadipate transaminase|nr:PLP-dependent aminotransferase family protein [Anaerolineae bacterium]
MATIEHIIPYRFSSEGQHLKRSVMRELLKRASEPDVISLAGGLPDSDLLPTAAYQACLNEVIAHEGGRALQYRPQYEPLRAWIGGWMRGRGVDCDDDQVMITNGNQQGLTILSKLFLEPGEPAAIEAITFTGVQQVTVGRDAHIHPIPVDLTTGADTDAIERIFAQYQPRLAVIIPDFHNPLGVSLTDEKRRLIAAMAGEYGVPVVEDDPYSALRFYGEALPPIRAYDRSDYVFYLGSFSKMLAPGLRLGWMIAPRELVSRITTIRESIDLESSALTQRAVYQFVSNGQLEPHLAQMNAENRVRCEAMLSALDQHLGSIAHWTKPDGGLFVWLTLPEAINTWDLLPRAIDEQRVAYIPGSAFSVSGGHHNTMRLNFSNGKPDLIVRGVARLADVIRAAL